MRLIQSALKMWAYCMASEAVALEVHKQQSMAMTWREHWRTFRSGTQLTRGRACRHGEGALTPRVSAVKETCLMHCGVYIRSGKTDTVQFTRGLKTGAFLGVKWVLLQATQILL